MRRSRTSTVLVCVAVMALSNACSTEKQLSHDAIATRDRESHEAGHQATPHESATAPTVAESATPPEAAANDADVDFATSMIPHHEQALQMVKLAHGRPTSAEFQALIAQLEAVQSREVVHFRELLDTWGATPPTAATDEPGAAGEAHGEHSAMPGMPGMLTPAHLHSLATAPDDKFERLWLQLMIRHHEGAIAMADAELSDGRSPEALTMAIMIMSGQRQEIDQMRHLLGYAR